MDGWLDAWRKAEEEILEIAGIRHAVVLFNYSSVFLRWNRELRQGWKGRGTKGREREQGDTPLAAMFLLLLREQHAVR